MRGACRVRHRRRNRLLHLGWRELIVGIEVGIDLIDLPLRRSRDMAGGAPEQQPKACGQCNAAAAKPSPMHTHLPVTPMKFSSLSPATAGGADFAQDQNSMTKLVRHRPVFAVLPTGCG